MGRAENSIVFAPHFQAGGVQSLHSVCEWLKEFGRSTIAPFMTGEALSMGTPTAEQRSVVRDGREEKQDWLSLLESLDIRRSRFAWLRR